MRNEHSHFLVNTIGLVSQHEDVEKYNEKNSIGVVEELCPLLETYFSSTSSKYSSKLFRRKV